MPDNHKAASACLLDYLNPDSPPALERYHLWGCIMIRYDYLHHARARPMQMVFYVVSEENWRP
jgi:hypothetical protein